MLTLRLSIITVLLFGVESLAIRAQEATSQALLTIGEEVELRDEDESILARPIDIAQTLNGALFVVDFSDRNIKVYDAAGKRVRTLGRAGRGPNQFGAVLNVIPDGDRLYAYDFLRSNLITLDTVGTELARVSLMSSRGSSQPTSVRGLDPDLLLAVHQAGHGQEGLLQILEAGTWVTRHEFMPLAEWYESYPHLRGRESVIADGRDGCVFAATSMSDSLRVFDYSGDLLASGTVDLTDRWLPPVSADTADDNGHFVRNLVAVSGCRVLVHSRVQRPGHATTPRRLSFDGGQLDLVRAHPGRGLEILASMQLVDGGLVGRDRDGRGIVLRRPSERQGNFRLLYVTTPR